MSDSPTVDVRDEFHAEPREALVPGRMRRPLAYVAEDCGGDLSADLGKWLFHHEALLRSERGPDDCPAFLWHVPGFEDHAAELAARVRQAITSAVTAESLEAVGVPEFDLGSIELFPVLLHHGCHFGWHDDWIGPDGAPAITRRVAFDLFLHTDPKQFTGGMVEFPCGDLIEPDNGSVLLRHPLQAYRIHEVVCRSRETLHGRWSISGWIHGAPPDGWIERVERLRSIPTI